MPKTQKKKPAAKAKSVAVDRRGRPRKHPPKPVKTEMDLLMEKNREELKVGYFTQKFPLPVVFICSSFSGDGKECLEKAKRYARFAVSRYSVPVTPHLMYPHFLRNAVESERKIGFYCGLCLLDKCSEIWIFGDIKTNDMEWEVWRAYMRDKTIRWFTEDLKEVERELPEQCRSLNGPVVKPVKKETKTVKVTKVKKEKKAV